MAIAMKAAAETAVPPIHLRSLGRRDYEPLWRAMQRFTEERTAETPDEVWFAEHPPVFTLGLNGDRSHLLDPGDIPVVPVDRGGQVTYHGPGQLMIYPLLDLRRSGFGVRDLVTALEQSAVDLLAEHRVTAASRKDAPGVYVGGRKIASVGLRIRRGSSFHGMAFNIDIDLKPFSRINPCGFADLEVTNCRLESIAAERQELQEGFISHFLERVRPGAQGSAERLTEPTPYLS